MNYRGIINFKSDEEKYLHEHMLWNTSETEILSIKYPRYVPISVLNIWVFVFLLEPPQIQLSELCTEHFEYHTLYDVMTTQKHS